MKRSYRKWLIPVALLSVLAAQFYARPEMRAFFSVDYWQSVLRYGKVLRIVESRYVHADDVNFEEFTDTALSGAVRSLDNYSDYMVADDYDAFNMAANQEYVGVGIEVSEFSGRVTIAQVFEQGSAEQAGILSGDFIVGVDGENTRGETLSEVVDRIRGEPGTIVTMEVERPINHQVLSFDLERMEIALDAVVDIEMREDAIGYFKIRQFTDHTDKEMVAAIDQLVAEGMRRLIIDLRGNPGGRLDTAARMAEVFLDKGQTILTVQSRHGVEDVFHSRGSTHYFRGELVVLIDGFSASASEILAGALRDHGRAILVGQKSYGKGSVQSVIGFPGGDGLKLTSARYLLPNGEAINGTGVYPDITIESTTEQSMLLRLQRHHLRRMSRKQFEEIYGFAPAEDEALRVATQLLGSTASLELVGR
ncbi:MAG: S41 family peptidase [Opitutaceae bacterium]